MMQSTWLWLCCIFSRDWTNPRNTKTIQRLFMRCSKYMFIKRYILLFKICFPRSLLFLVDGQTSASVFLPWWSAYHTYMVGLLVICVVSVTEEIMSKRYFFEFLSPGPVVHEMHHNRPTRRWPGRCTTVPSPQKFFFSLSSLWPIMKHYSMLWYYRPTYLHYSYLQIYNFQLLTKLHTANADWFKFHSNGGLGYRFGTLRSYTSFFGHFPGTSLKSPRQLYKIADRFLSITLFSLVYSASNAISLSVPVNLGLCALCITDCKKQRRGCLERDFVLRHKTETVGARPRPRQ